MLPAEFPYICSGNFVTHPKAITKHVWLNLIYVEQMASKDTKRQVSKYIVNYYYYFYLLPAQSHAV